MERRASSPVHRRDARFSTSQAWNQATIQAVPRFSPRFLLCNPLIGPCLKQIERQSPAVEHLIVKFADVKLGPQFLLGTLPQFADLKLAQFVTERLCRPRDIAVGLGLDRRLIYRARFAEELHDLISA